MLSFVAGPISHEFRDEPADVAVCELSRGGGGDPAVRIEPNVDADLARKLYVRRVTVSHWETSKTLPDIQSILIFAIGGMFVDW